MSGVRSALWILVVGEVFASFAHPFFYLGHGGGGSAAPLLLLPGGAFSFMGGIVLLYFAASLERATEALARTSGRTASLVVLGALCFIPGVRVVGELFLLLRLKRHVAAAVNDDGAVGKRVSRLIVVRALVQALGVLPALSFMGQVEYRGDIGPWLAVSVCPLGSLVLLLVVARTLTGALADHYGTSKPLAGLGAGEPVAMSMRDKPQS